MLPADQRLFEKPGDKHAAVETPVDTLCRSRPIGDCVDSIESSLFQSVTKASILLLDGKR